MVRCTVKAGDGNVIVVVSLTALPTGMAEIRITGCEQDHDPVRATARH
jgi:hypothetical protein